MNHIILSIQPQWLAKILNGEKTVEIRKTVPKLPCTVWLYCTKAKPLLGYDVTPYYSGWFTAKNEDWFTDVPMGFANSQIVAKFVMNEVEKMDNETILDYRGSPEDVCYCDDHYEQIIKNAQVNYEEIAKYANGKPLFAWHIANLAILDKPLTLGDFQSYAVKYFKGRPTKSEDIKDIIKSSARYTFYRGEITRAPQSWQYCTPKGESL